MSTTLDILILPTNNVETLYIADASTYATYPPTSPIIHITVPEFDEVTLSFVPNSYKVYNSVSLGITNDIMALPDGVYTVTYGITNPTVSVTKTFLRVEKLMEKFDGAFMKLDMMECDKAIKMQSKVDLNSIYLFIQGAIASANNCAIFEANKLYVQANKMLNCFIGNNCNCSGSNYIINFS